ncbi:MAG: hypothetical protein HRT69_01640 [Flavobacteriaceae bacterium]|nr:hypothetical protein [Flavobacteriaceae bacterium]
MIKHLFTFIFILFYLSVATAQNERDIIVHDSLSYMVMFTNYPLAKKIILKLEEKYGYEPELKYRLISQSFKNNDLDFFKKELSILVEKYGFQLIYMKETEPYYTAIIEGELSSWFKEMYLKKHFIWMKNNFDKQLDLKKLNEIGAKDQSMRRFISILNNNITLDSIQKIKLYKSETEFDFENIADLYQITQKWKKYPSGKSFALIQRGFGIAEGHNLKAKDNFERFWLLFYPFYKKAYLNNEISYIHFKNYDSYSYVHYGYQKFGLLNIEEIHETYMTVGLKEIPLEDFDFYFKILKEFNWN